MNITEYLDDKKALIEKYLDKLMPKENEYPDVIHKAMRYSIFNGGKRLRPTMLLATTEAFGKVKEEAIYAAAAVELVHGYSLVHDDMPCMDNADIRRGKPSVHKEFSETIALLCGDALLTLGFKVLSRAVSVIKSKDDCRMIFEEFSDAIGSHGMIGGQVAEFIMLNQEKKLPEIQYIHTHKTGALIATSIRLGAFFAGANKKEINSLFRFGEFLGFCFQVMDDVVDNDGYVLIVGPKQARVEAEKLFALGRKELKFLGKRANRLIEIGEFILSQ